MKTYSVDDIVTMLNTNPETVRRWIRSGKLEAIQTSRKSGNAITEQSLNAFLKSNPKYAKMVAGSVGLLGLSGLIAGMPILPAMLLQIKKAQVKSVNQALQNSEFSPNEILNLIESLISDAKKTIATKKEEIGALKKEISEQEKQIQQLIKLKERFSAEK